MRRNCSVRDYKLQLQGPTSTVCGKYCCMFALYMDRGYTPKQFIGLFDADIADRQIEQMFTSEFQQLRGEPVVWIKGMSPLNNPSFPTCVAMEAVTECEFLTGNKNDDSHKGTFSTRYGVIQTFHFQSPYGMQPHGSVDNWLNWDDGHFPYHLLRTALEEAVAGYAHLYLMALQNVKLFPT